jgi:hypothetical protein
MIQTDIPGYRRRRFHTAGSAATGARKTCQFGRPDRRRQFRNQGSPSAARRRQREHRRRRSVAGAQDRRAGRGGRSGRTHTCGLLGYGPSPEACGSSRPGTQKFGLLGGPRAPRPPPAESRAKSRAAAASPMPGGVSSTTTPRPSPVVATLVTRPLRCRAVTLSEAVAAVTPSCSAKARRRSPSGLARNSPSTWPWVGVRPRPPASAQTCCLRAIPIFTSPIVTRRSMGSSSGSESAGTGHQYERAGGGVVLAREPDPVESG